MPYIDLKTNVKITDVQSAELESIFGQEIELLPGKSEKWLMTSVAGDVRMAFSGERTPCVFVQVSLFGKAPAKAYENLTASLCEKLEAVLGVSKDRIYVKYEEVSTWGWNGTNF